MRSIEIVDNSVFLKNDTRKAFLAVGNLAVQLADWMIIFPISRRKFWPTTGNQHGILLLQKMCAEFSFLFMHCYTNVREYLKNVSRTRTMPLTASDYFDDGTVLKVSISTNKASGEAFDLNCREIIIA